MKSLNRFLHNTDLHFLTLLVILLSFGLAMLYSASSVMATDKFQDSLYFLKRQSAFVVCGLFLMFWIYFSSHKSWLRLSFYLVLFSLFALMLTYIPAFSLESKGAARWIRVFGFTFQPVEILKVSWVLYLSNCFSLYSKKIEIKNWYEKKIVVLILWLISVGATLFQPDFGNALLIGILGLTMLFLSGFPFLYLSLLIIGGASAAAWIVFQEDYRRRRLMSFLNPWNDPLNTSYQIIQSFTAFHSGSLWGKGLGNSQEKLYFLPEVHTDFIGSVVAEEFGFVGFSLLLITFSLFCYRGFYIAQKSQRKESFLLASGASLLLAMEILFNLCVIMGLLPTKGIPLPFLSHGGSSLIASLALCGFILAVAKEKNNYENKNV